MAHMGEKAPPVNSEELIMFLVRLAEVAISLNPHISTPFAMEVGGEIELTDGEAEDLRASDIDSSSFDEDLDI